MDQYRSGEVRLLVATDVAARGLDVKDISYVINYDFPVDGVEVSLLPAGSLYMPYHLPGITILLLISSLSAKVPSLSAKVPSL